MLPFRCTFCSSVISAKEIQQSEQNGDGYHVQCSECGTMQDHTHSDFLFQTTVGASPLGEQLRST